MAESYQPIPNFETTFKVVDTNQCQEGCQTVEKNNIVTVHATGVVKETGKQFWSTKFNSEVPIQLRLGVGIVLPGLEQGLLGMKLGEVRELVIPAKEGYGENGHSGFGIPPNGTINFTLEMLNINKMKKLDEETC